MVLFVAGSNCCSYCNLYRFSDQLSVAFRQRQKKEPMTAKRKRLLWSRIVLLLLLFIAQRRHQQEKNNNRLWLFVSSSFVYSTSSGSTLVGSSCRFQEIEEKLFMFARRNDRDDFHDTLFIYVYIAQKYEGFVASNQTRLYSFGDFFLSKRWLQISSLLLFKNRSILCKPLEHVEFRVLIVFITRY